MSTLYPNHMEHTAPARRALEALLGFGRALLSGVQAAIAKTIPAARLPRAITRNPVTAERRIVQTLEWLTALARTLAGDRTWLRIPTYAFPRFPAFPPLTNDLREQIGLPRNPPSTDAQRAARRLRYIRDVFETQPVAVIAARLARRLGVTAPRELTAIGETPVQFTRMKKQAPSFL